MGLHSLQHRGQEGSGIVTTDGEQHYATHKLGLVNKIKEDSIDSLIGTSAIGHTRYATSGPTDKKTLQPFTMKTKFGWLAIAHNGNLTNAAELSAELEKEGSIFQSNSDTEVFIHLIAKKGVDCLIEALPEVLHKVEGAYSLLILNHENIIAVRDPYGFRPLVMGTLDDSLVFASETCAFDLIGAKYKREVFPGEVLIASLDGKNIKSFYPLEQKKLSRCIFEHIYFARPDGNLFGSSVYRVRKDLGKKLAQEQPVDADIVIPVPDSGVPAAIGYSRELKMPFEVGIVRSHYVRRTFIEPKQSIRDFSVKLKLNPIEDEVRNKKVVVIDDSLVRGTTCKKIIRMLRNVGAAEVHVRISSPPTVSPCIYGIDTPTKEELVASYWSKEQICQKIDADSLEYLSLDGLLKVVEYHSGEGFCSACFSGEYPTQKLVNLGIKKAS